MLRILSAVILAVYKAESKRKAVKMKDFHPSGVAVSTTGAHTYYLLKDCRDGSSPRKCGTLPGIVVSPAEFEQLVREDRIQLFAHNGKEIVTFFTEEERKVFARSYKRLGPMTLEEYYSAEATFSDIGFGEPGVISIAIPVVQIFKLGDMPSLSCALYIPGLTDELFMCIKKRVATTACRSMANMVMLPVLMPKLGQLLSILPGRVTINTMVMLQHDNPFYEISAFGFRRPGYTEIHDVNDLIATVVEQRGGRQLDCGSVFDIPGQAVHEVSGPAGVRRMSF